MDPKNIMSVLKEASPFDLFLVSFFLLPFAFDGWLAVAEKLEIGVREKVCSLGIVLLVYIVGVIAMLVGSSRAKRREIARDQVIQYLTANKFEMMSFETVRNNINKAYTDKFLEGLVAHFPNDVRKAKLKGGKPGIARIIESEKENEG